MDPITAGAVVVGGSQLLSGIGNMFTGAAASKKQYQRSKQLMKDQYALDLQQWHRSNEYNSPVQQMQRLKAAGLNPNLIYKGGAGSSGMAASSSPQAKGFAIPQEKYTIPDILPTLSAYQDYQIKDAQLALIKSNTLNTDTQQAINFAKKIKEEYEAQIKYGAPYDHDAKKNTLAKELMETQNSIALQNLRRVQIDNAIRLKDKKYYLMRNVVPPVTSGLKGFMSLFRGG